MVITEVRVFPVDEDKLKAFASIVIDDAFVVSDIKIIQGKNGRFLSMPSTKRRNGTFRDIAHPLNQQTRHELEEMIFRRYDEVLASDLREEPHGEEGSRGMDVATYHHAARANGAQVSMGGLSS